MRWGELGERVIEGMEKKDLEGDKNGVRLGDDPHNDGPLLHGFRGIFDLEDATLGGAG